MLLEDVTLPLGAGLVDLITVLAVEILGGFQYWQVQFRDRVETHIGMSLGQMIDQHSSSLEAKHAGLALVDKSVQFSW